MKMLFLSLLVAPWLLGCPFGKDDGGGTDPLTRLRNNPAGKWRVREAASGKTFDFTITNDKTVHEGLSFFRIDPPLAIESETFVGILVLDDGGKTYVGWLQDEGGGSLEAIGALFLRVEGNDIVLGGDSETYEVTRLTPL